ncbi:restriction endonuclease subunit S [Parabacteroides leei]|uniref:restriction endonuclease subunit S n=2 Tax=Parabacteroides leei TaxID=2939491 RepID=UPI001896AC82|nr:restriction endonuclease subunit S [Parabacteroides goldsteinii]
MQTYEKYKDSGVEWIGKVPEHWEIRRLKTDTFLKGRIGWNGLRSDEFKESSYAYLVTGQDFTGPNINWDKCYQIDKVRYDEDPFIQLQNGDILITKDGTIGKISKVSRMDKPACLNSGIFVMKQRSSHLYEQGYIYWLLTSNLLSEYNQYTSTGTTILHLYQNVFENMPLLIPTLLEQQAIVSYLDKKCADIDKVIATQQRRIELLQELKQSTITHAVTRGLNPNAKMKDSGVEWIGEVPEHWELIPFKYISDIIMGQSPSGDDIKSEGKQLFMQGNADFSSLYPQPSLYCDKCKKFSRVGDVLMSVRAPVGELNISDRVYGIGRGLCSIKSKEISQRYLWYLLIKSKSDFSCFTTGSTFDAISIQILKSFISIIPSFSEQQAIATYLDKKCAELDASISKAQREIDLLQEYKQALITEVVTGKRKVC